MNQDQYNTFYAGATNGLNWDEVLFQEVSCSAYANTRPSVASWGCVEDCKNNDAAQVCATLVLSHDRIVVRMQEKRIHFTYTGVYFGFVGEIQNQISLNRRRSKFELGSINTFIGCTMKVDRCLNMNPSGSGTTLNLDSSQAFSICLLSVPAHSFLVSRILGAIRFG